MSKLRVPAVDWFSMDDAAPRLVGARGIESGSYFWPTGIATSANPAAPGEAREAVHFSRRGRLWSWTTNHYAPPEPYVSPDPFVPYTVCAVHLETEGMTVLGQLAADADPASLSVDLVMELVVEPLYEDDAAQYMVWKWTPAPDTGLDEESRP